MTSAPCVIGLEIHVQLKTRTKLFCGDTVAFDDPPNTHVCPVCLGLPGALPVPNAHAVELALRAAHALRCSIHPVSCFTRKNYFYPDLPKGYQITQFEEPIATGGELRCADGSSIRIRRAHIEEDAGKLLHERFAGKTAIDMNRAGVPLLEIVTEPDLESPAQARAFLVQLKRTLQYLDVSDCEMEKGSLRVDANVSLAGGQPTELKNLNSFAAIERALTAELTRQKQLADAGTPVTRATISWNDVSGTLRVLRAKEAGGEYRYVAEPDLPRLVVDAAVIAEVAADQTMLPLERAAHLHAAYGLKPGDADVLSASRQLADFFEETVRLTGDAHAAAMWTMRDVLGTSNALQTKFAIAPAQLAEVIGLVKEDALSVAGAHVVLRRICETGRSARDIMRESDLSPMRDAAQADVWMRELAASHPAELERLRNGEEKLSEFFVGQLMRLSNGRLDPRVARAAVTRVLQDV